MTPEEIACVAYEAGRALQRTFSPGALPPPWDDLSHSHRAAITESMKPTAAGIVDVDTSTLGGHLTATIVRALQPAGFDAPPPARGYAGGMLKRVPVIGSGVHYVSYGTPGGEYRQECRAAIVTKVVPDDPSGPLGIWLAVLNPTGIFLDGGITLDTGRVQVTNGGEQRTHLCLGRTYEGGTWHWPATS